MECRICKSNELTLYYVQGHQAQYRYYRCKNCKLVNLDLNSIVIAESQQKYFDNYKPPRDYEKVTGSYNAYKFVSKYVPAPGIFLDIGCGFGSVLYFFRKFGWQTKGLELSQQLADHVIKNLNIEVEVCDFLKY
jgi:SAM-dependent methyltransferase